MPYKQYLPVPTTCALRISGLSSIVPPLRKGPWFKCTYHFGPEQLCSNSATLLSYVIISYQYVDLTSCHDCLYWHVGFVLAMCTLAETEEQGKNSKVRRYSHG